MDKAERRDMGVVWRPFSGEAGGQKKLSDDPDTAITVAP
jgi:hypothetical protein